MKLYHKQLFYIVIVFTALLLASFLLFQIESQTARFKIYPEFTRGTKGVMSDMVFAIVAFILHLLCLSIWWNTIRIRVIQRGVRLYLFLIHTIMLFYIVHCFFITSIYDTNLQLLRVSGYFVSIPFFFIPLFGYYASLCIGKESAVLHWKAYLLLIPAIVFTVLFLSSEFHSLLFVKLPGEKQPNLQFHTTMLSTFVFIWVIILESAKSWHILKISEGAKRLKFFKRVPFYIVFVEVAYILPIYMQSYVVEYELIENIASFFLMEIFIWESCIAVGMVQVNSYHKQVFDTSSILMQITDDEGNVFRTSKNSAPITKQEFVKLKQNKVLYKKDTAEKYISKLSKGYLIWEKDVRELNFYIKELKELQKRLHDEVEITKLEATVRAEQVKVKERQRIYNTLALKLSKQSDMVTLLLKDLLGKSREQTSIFLGKLILIATYIKRYSNLYLISENNENIYAAELRLCFSEIKQILEELNINNELVFNIPDDKKIKSRFCLYCCRIWEYAIEFLNFELLEVLFLANSREEGQGEVDFIISIIKANAIKYPGFKTYINNRLEEEDIKNTYDTSVYETDEGLVIEMKGL